MTPEHWQHVDQVLEAALEREPGQRAAFVAKVCASDEALRREVESLLDAHERSGRFLDTPPADADVQVLAADHSKAMLGRVVGHYKILSRLGVGGMGEVYLARDTRLSRKVALKFLRSHLTANEERVQRFQHEAYAASALNHPNILTIYEVGQADELHYIAAEYVEGATLRRRMAGRTMRLGDVLDVAMQIASALVAAHEAGITHRDIKPENIMLRLSAVCLARQSRTDHACSGFRKAIEVARSQGATTFELRAALSLADVDLREGRAAVRDALAHFPEPEPWPEIMAAHRFLQ